MSARLVCVGRLREEKGQLILQDPMKIVVGEAKSLELVLPGEGEMRGAA